MIKPTNIIFKDPKIKECFDAIGYEESSLSLFRRKEKFRASFANILAKELTWDFVCDTVNKDGCFKYGALFLSELLNKNLLIATDEILTALHENLSPCLQNGRTCPAPLFCNDKIVDALFYKAPSGRKGLNVVYAFMPCENKYFKQLVRKFLEAQRNYNRWHTKTIISLFAKSLEHMLNGILSYKDLNENTFWQQINYYKRTIDKDTIEFHYSVLSVCNFYRWLVNTYTEYNFFSNSFRLNRRLLFSSQAPIIIENDYYVTTLDSKNPPLGQSNICFIIRNLGHLSSIVTNDDFLLISLESLKSQFYRDLIIRYLLSANSPAPVISIGQISYIRDSLHFLEMIKAEEDYPNPDIFSLNTKEAVLLRNFNYDEKVQLSTMNNKIGAIRRFFDWCKVNNHITFENMFFDYLKQYEEPPKTTGHAVPDADLVKLHDYIVKRVDNNYMWQMLLYIFHLLLDTDFRISQLLHLDINCISPSLKSGEYVLHANTKVTHDVRSHTFMITEATYRLLMEAINYTDEVRQSCSDPNIKDYIFLYRGVNAVRLMDVSLVRRMFKAACEEIGIKHYTPANLRDTYMTKSFEYIQRHGKSDIEMGLLSKHKSIDTTKSHYIQQNLEKMLESTYGVDLSGTDDVDAESKVVDSIPEAFRSYSRDVQNGCGKCKSEECFVKGPAPCLICKDFITTAEYEKFFISAIEKIDATINHAACRHDVEDLVLTKTLYVKFLEAIYKRKELNNDH